MSAHIRHPIGSPESLDEAISEHIAGYDRLAAQRDFYIKTLKKIREAAINLGEAHPAAVHRTRWIVSEIDSDIDRGFEIVLAHLFAAAGRS